MHHDNPAVEVIRDGDSILALIVRSTFSEPGVHFLSPSDFSQQLGVIHHKAGHSIPPHVHNLVSRKVLQTQETLFIRSGRCKVDLYCDERTWVTSRELGAGDVILLATGGHGLEILEDCSIVEVKQGPYAGDGDKTHFDVVER